MSRALPIDRDQLRAALRELLDGDPRQPAARPAVLAAVAAARQRHRDAHGAYAVDGHLIDHPARLTALAQELGDVACQLGPNAVEDPDMLHDELIEVAAVALAWLDHLDELDGAPF
ncbi:hypothetical protein GCM10012275_58100 [Longimycelium tulufanense]|uniref:Uncharacterized protein n=1 Tax=Longimycelium tulufanense TaxID=907463 RepID=A0A8J3CDV5_9PSEU|nr:hypothetical protein [Longimycelium tulufanense]GGM79881.1 hypothetical protein GCM10012275_58100 [Longimycelium tulufanense]